MNGGGGSEGKGVLEEEGRLGERGAEEGGVSRVDGEGVQAEGQRRGVFSLAEEGGGRGEFHDEGVEGTGEARAEVFEEGFLGGPVVVKTAGLVGGREAFKMGEFRGMVEATGDGKTRQTPQFDIDADGSGGGSTKNVVAGMGDVEMDGGMPLDDGFAAGGTEDGVSRGGEAPAVAEGEGNKPLVDRPPKGDGGMTDVEDLPMKHAGQVGKHFLQEIGRRRVGRKAGVVYF